ncbi:MAG TPA: type II secretion system F family protein [Candidatus Babeliales bacterium]|nr:type II secretion system F family protein [Candidatus Babeliales bacterium]
MPYYKWNGIDLTGKNFYGKMFASSERILQEYLLKQEIGLVRADLVPDYQWARTISLAQKAAFFKQFAKLLRAGLLVPQVLSILSKQGYGKLCDVANELKANIDRGASLYDSAKAFPEIFDMLILQLIQVGQRSSGLADSLDQLSTYLQARVKFYKKLRSLLIMPCITLLFFIAVVSIIFIALVPAFERVFILIDKTPPVHTQWLFYISHLSMRFSTLACLSIFIAGIYGCSIYFARDNWKGLRDKVILHIPFYQKIVRQYAYSYYFQALSALCASGIPLLKATEIAVLTIDNTVIVSQLSQVGPLIETGYSLSESLVIAMGSVVDHQALALVHVGEETSSLSSVCSELSYIYFDKSQRRLSTLLMIIQPTLMLLLGIFIAVLVISVYVPLLSMPDVMSAQLG